jgi:hypothetical protein
MQLREPVFEGWKRECERIQGEREMTFGPSTEGPPEVDFSACIYTQGQVRLFGKKPKRVFTRAKS